MMSSIERKNTKSVSAMNKFSLLYSLFATQAHLVFAAQTPVHQSPSLPKVAASSLPTAKLTRLQRDKLSALMSPDPASSPSPSPSPFPTITSPSASAPHSPMHICPSNPHPLVFYGHGPHDCLLPECGGHCKSDIDCSIGLFCYRPSERSDEAVPGCDTPPFKDVNYCVSKQFSPSASPSHSPSKSAEHSYSMELRSLRVPTNGAVTIVDGWYQLGDDINGEAAGDWSGRSVGMNGDGR